MTIFLFRRILSLSLLFSVLSCGGERIKTDQQVSDAIRINQLGYFPDAPKKAVLTESTSAKGFMILKADDQEIVYEGVLSEEFDWKKAGEKVKIADFTPFDQKGDFLLYVEGIGQTAPFSIAENIYDQAFPASLKALYYQRAGMVLEEKYAGKWAREAGHPDDSVLFHPSSGRQGVISSPKGWYDAGDYGKYVVNGAFPLGQMLLLYEQYPELLGDKTLNIPESGNGIPDILDELKYEMDWLLTMQDEDGGLFFKLTTKRFEGMVLPEKAKQTRYIIGKGTAPSLDFAAVAAKASRIFNQIDSSYAQTCWQAAQKAWDWAQDHPQVIFKNPEDVITGEYGDADFSQEFYWAAAELYVSRGDEKYLEYLKAHPMDFTFRPGESWRNFMHYLGAFALLNSDKEVSLIGEIKEQILATADSLLDVNHKNDYFQPISDFQWGSNSDVMNSALIIAQAYRLTSDKKYLQAVREICDYIFGKNATGYSFLTGFGHQQAKFIHHRPSEGDEIPEPVPGLLIGGPNSRREDAQEVNYPEDVAPMKSWVDEVPSYASNEICLNWNAPLVYVLGFLKAEAQ
ncbi:MAG: glycoside hydrolase family 9 protein [Bacteroidota bacterium]